MMPRDVLVKSVGSLPTPRLGAPRLAKRLTPSRKTSCESASIAVRLALQQNIATTLADIPSTSCRSWLEELLVARRSSVELITEALLAQLGEQPSKDEVAAALGDIDFLTQLRSLVTSTAAGDSAPETSPGVHPARWKLLRTYSPKGHSTDETAQLRWAVKFEDGQMCRYNAQQVRNCGSSCVVPSQFI